MHYIGYAHAIGGRATYRKGVVSLYIIAYARTAALGSEGMFMLHVYAGSISENARMLRMQA
eukprot:3738296-Pleurochrysis_carterae.AAC.2